MPNWCLNNLTVTGDAKSVARFRRSAKGRTHAYHDFHKKGWAAFDDIRLKALISTPPELGEESDLAFHQLYPVPQEVLSVPYDHRSATEIYNKLDLPDDERPQSGYEWERINWGVKWGASDAHMHHSEDKMVCYSFQTPWSPPMDFMEKIVKDYPELCFKLEYEEPGMAFAGKTEWQDGLCTFEDSWDIEDHSDWDDE